MSFNFNRDHCEIHSKISDSIEYKYLREYYLRFTSRGIYTSQISNKTSFRTIEIELNSSINLATLACNSILNSNDENFIKFSIDSSPTYLYKLFLKCAILTMNDYAIHLLISKWPFEKLELDCLKQPFSSLLIFYNTDINSFTGKLAPEILKWLLIGSRYTKLITNLFLKNQNLPDYKLKYLDITDLPVSDSLLKKLLNRCYDCINGDYEISDSEDTDESFDIFTTSESDISSDDSDDTCSTPDFDASESEEECYIENYSESSESNVSIKNNKKHKKDDFIKRSYFIKLDPILVKLSNFEKFNKIIQARQTKKELITGLNLIFNRLEITIRNNRYFFNNELIDDDALKITGLGVFFNSGLNESLFTFNFIKKFKNIQDLNLSTFGYDTSLQHVLDNSASLDSLSSCFSEFKHLKRLRINISGTKNNLKYLLQNLSNPLEYLNLTSCGLNASDLHFLSESIHVNSINNLVLSNNDLNSHFEAVILLLKKMKSNLQVLDLGCNSFNFDVYFKIVDEAISKMDNLRMLVTLDVFTFDNYIKLADRLSQLDKFISWRINYSSDYYEKSVKIKNKYKFRKFKSDYLEALEKKFIINNPNDNKIVKITINDPDLNYILNEIF